MALRPDLDALGVILEVGGEPLRLCYQCGTCTATCPWNLVKSFRIRKLIQQSQVGLVDFDAEETWMCTTCKACVDRCPRGVEIIDIMRSLRRVVAEIGASRVPDSLRLTLKSIAGEGNPLGEAREKRNDWTKGRDVKIFSKDSELLYFSCCIPAYEPKVKRVALATSEVLNSSGVKYGILGAEQSCCGESVRKAGNESLFQTLAQSNSQAFKEKGVKKILTSSPHCYHTFKKEYPEFGGNFEVVHFTQYLAQLIDEKKIKFSKELNLKVAYHDPCYLGRHSGVYDEPRKVLQSIPGVQLVELADAREQSICCGGGGGRIWMETKKGERFSDIRVNQALEVGAQVLAVACPYCMLNFEDSVLTLDKGDAIKIMDIAELVREAI
jgi:Fe-S oxidoreductase